MINLAPEMRSEPRAWENQQVMSGYSGKRGRWHKARTEKYKVGEKVREAECAGRREEGQGKQGSAASWIWAALRPVRQRADSGDRASGTPGCACRQASPSVPVPRAPQPQAWSAADLTLAPATWGWRRSPRASRR